MTPLFTRALLSDISSAVDDALADVGIVNVSRLAQRVQTKNVEANVALEDIAAELMRMAQGRGAMMEFDNRLDAAE
ncbi:MAG: hypothetical protein KF723_21865 [Rhizobiaceae bacterium]|nr:hypothetical protein [Rhizobiaceae bacterium]